MAITVVAFVVQIDANLILRSRLPGQCRQEEEKEESISVTNYERRLTRARARSVRNANCGEVEGALSESEQESKGRKETPMESWT